MKIFTLLFFLSSPLYTFESLIKDYENFYTRKTATILIASFIPAAILAQSTLDMAIDNFYQKNIRSDTTDQAAKIFKIFGSNKPLSIAFISGTFCGYLLKNSSSGKNLYDLCINSFRAISVGMPLLIAGQNFLGADRPNQNTNSFYHPFKNDHGVSGHAFMGAVPFIAASFKTNKPFLKTFLYASSTLTGLSRINDSAHYPSQVLLGWALAYCSVYATYKTNLEIVVNQNKISLGGIF
jgi:membrane-associated phospholipid phosphatase